MILAATKDDTSALGAYAAFTAAILVWGWQEMAFLMGFITGPSRLPCPPECSGVQRFTAAAQAIIYHEASLLFSLLVVLAITRTGSNRVGVLTFLVLWVMRLSAKLNLFLGVRNRSEDFLPHHLHYLQTFFKRKNINPLFPFSVVLPSIVAVLGWVEVFAHQPMSAESLGLNFVCALLSLAVLEHLFMVLPLNPALFWGWATRSQSQV